MVGSCAGRDSQRGFGRSCFGHRCTPRDFLRNRLSRIGELCRPEGEIAGASFSFDEKGAAKTDNVELWNNGGAGFLNPGVQQPCLQSAIQGRINPVTEKAKGAVLANKGVIEAAINSEGEAIAGKWRCDLTEEVM